MLGPLSAKTYSARDGEHAINCSRCSSITGICRKLIGVLTRWIEKKGMGMASDDKANIIHFLAYFLVNMDTGMT